MDQLTASVGAIVGTSALLYFMTAPCQRHRNGDLHLTPWEEQSSITRSRKFCDKFRKRRGGNRNLYRSRDKDYSHSLSSLVRKTSTSSSLDDEEEEVFEGCTNSTDRSVTSDQS
jgi:hypothetical protein